MTEVSNYSQRGVPAPGAGEMMWLLTCNRCGAVIMDQPLHDKWHREQKTAHIIGPGLFP